MTARSFTEALEKAAHLGDEPDYFTSRETLIAQRDSARDWAVALESQNARLEDFARWLVSMDDPEDVIGLGERQSVNLTKIIAHAVAALTGGEDDARA